MKQTVWVIVILVLALVIVLEHRYVLIVNSPVVAKMDRITGDVWVANSGVWRKISPSQDNDQSQKDQVKTSDPSAKPVSAK